MSINAVLSVDKTHKSSNKSADGRQTCPPNVLLHLLLSLHRSLAVDQRVVYLLFSYCVSLFNVLK